MVERYYLCEECGRDEFFIDLIEATAQCIHCNHEKPLKYLPVAIETEAVDG